MKVLYLDCGMGAAGDMLTAALLELLPDREAFLEKLNGLGLPGVEYRLEPSVKCGITGSHVRVLVNGQEEETCDHPHEHQHGEEHHHHDHPHDHGEHHHHGEEHHHHYDHDHHHDHEEEHHHHHHHTGMEEILHLLSHTALPPRAAENARRVYTLIAQAESKAHGVEVDQIHFHEVGSLDAVADVAAVCWLMEELAVDQVVVSPVAVGSGHVHCAHGVLPVPAPATAHILQGVPTWAGQVPGELCTPTGAALLKTFAAQFGPQPLMTVEAIGYGMGTKDFPVANCVRAMLGNAREEPEQLALLSCNLDDSTGEEIGFALTLLLEAGALDAYTIPIGMKKNRPGVMLCCLCKEADRDRLAALMLRHTTTLGVRWQPCSRYALDRRMDRLDTPYGPVRVKTAQGYGVKRQKLEQEDLARIARTLGVSLRDVAQALLPLPEDLS